MKKMIFLLSVSLLVACSGTKPGERSDGPQTPVEKVAASKGATNNVEARKAFEEALTNLDKVDIDADSKEAPSAQTAQVLTPAEAKLAKAVEIDPNFGKAWFNLGVIRERLGKKAEAKDAYLRAIQASPKLAAPHVNLGMMAFEESGGDPQAAKGFFEDAIAADSWSTEAHSNLSAVNRLSRDYVRAVSHARRSLAGDSLNIDAYANLARTYYQRGNYDVALLVALNAFKLEAERPDIHNIVGLVWLKKSDVTEAIRQFRTALKLDPNYVPALMNLGAVMLNVRNYDKAIELFDKAAQVDPKNLEAKISSAVAHRGKGDLEVAQKMYDEVQQVDPQNAMIAYNQGILEQEQYAQNAQKGVGGEAPPDDPIKMMDWQIENIKRSMKHYENAIGHYNDYLAWEKPDREESRREAQKRITQVEEILRLSAEQIPQLEMQKQEIAEDLRLQQEQEQAAAAEQGGGGE